MKTLILKNILVCASSILPGVESRFDDETYNINESHTNMTSIWGQNGSGSRTIIFGTKGFVNKDYHFGMEGVQLCVSIRIATTLKKK